MFTESLTSGPELENAIMRRARPYRGENPEPGKGGHRPDIEPRKPHYRVPTLFRVWKATWSGASSRAPGGPAWSKNLACAEALWTGTGRSQVLASGGAPLWSASGRREAVADDARTWEVRLCHSSCEADEQSRATGCGAGGAKGGGRGEG